MQILLLIVSLRKEKTIIIIAGALWAKQESRLSIAGCLRYLSSIQLGHCYPILADVKTITVDIQLFQLTLSFIFKPRVFTIRPKGSMDSLNLEIGL